MKILLRMGEFTFFQGEKQMITSFLFLSCVSEKKAKKIPE